MGKGEGGVGGWGGISEWYLEMKDGDDVELHVLGCRVDVLGTNSDQWFSVALRPPRLSHSS